MAKLRRLEISERAIALFTALEPTDEEWTRVTSCLKALAADPTAGRPMMFTGYPGNHHYLECSRFLFVYQYSDAEVRIKAVRLAGNYE